MSWDEIEKHISKSNITIFQPTPSENSPRVFDAIDFEKIESHKNSILSRCDTAIAADVSRYYPTIYTHSIAWALHTKEWCKENVHNDCLKASTGQMLDDLVRKGQDGQSIGVPLGPDTSVVLAEIIGAAVDQELTRHLGLEEETALRFTDDFFIGLRDGRTVESTLATLASTLSKYELEMNADKTKVVTAAGRSDPDWALEISQFRLPSEISPQRKALNFYFKKAFHEAEANPTQNVINYCVSRARSFNIGAENWPIFEEFLMQCARANSTAIETVAQILIDGKRNGMTINEIWVDRLISDLIAKNAPLDHHWELCWLIFLARELNLKLGEDSVDCCERVDGSAVALLLLDLGARELADVGRLKHRLARNLTSNSLFSPEWLVAYEGASRGWLGEEAKSVVSKDKFFGTLIKLKAAFYNTSRTTQPIAKEKVDESGTTYSLSYFSF